MKIGSLVIPPSLLAINPHLRAPETRRARPTTASSVGTPIANRTAVGITVTIPGLLKSVVSRIRGRDRSKPVLFENIFNQIHAPTQVLATGDSAYDDGTIRFNTTRTHGLFSSFEWRVEAD